MEDPTRTMLFRLQRVCLPVSFLSDSIQFQSSKASSLLQIQNRLPEDNGVSRIFFDSRSERVPFSTSGPRELEGGLKRVSSQGLLLLIILFPSVMSIVFPRPQNDRH
jgi:hypothetical protein